MARACVLLALGVAAACGDRAPVAPAPAPAPATTRLELQLGPGARPVEPERLVARYDLTDPEELARWTVDAGARGLRRLPGAPDDPDAPYVLYVAEDDRDEAITLTRPGSYRPGEANLARLRLAFRGGGAISSAIVALRRGGDNEVGSETAMLANATRPIDVPIPLLVRPDAAEVCEELVVELERGRRRAHVLSVELLAVPRTHGLPDPEGPPRLVEIDGDARRAEIVTAGRPGRLEFLVPEQGQLDLVTARSPGRRRASARLVLDVRDEAGELFTQVEYPHTARWVRRSLDLAPLAGQLVTVDLTTHDPAETWYVAQVHAFTPRKDPPVVLLVTTDTHRADHLGAAGSDVDVATPTLDALAARGVLFEQCFSPTNSTNPAHVALMTGVHPRDTGILSNHQRLADHASTMAEAFAAAGWRTHAIVSTQHLGDVGSGLGQGFDRMAWPTRRDAEASRAVELATRSLAHTAGRPLLLWVHVFDAHTPYLPPPALEHRYYPRGRDPFDDARPPIGPPEALPEDLVGVTDIEYPRARYRAEVTGLDAELGRLFGHPRLREAHVAVVGDHGEGLGEHVLFAHDGLSSQVVHVPLILAGPGVPEGRRVATPVAPLGLARTLADLAGVPHELPGDDLLARLASPRPEPLFMLGGASAFASVRHGDDYLVLSLVDHDTPRALSPTEAHQVQLFDLSTDPACRVDLVDERPEVAHRLWRGLTAWLADADPRLAGESVDDPEALEDLRRLGYTTGETRTEVLFEPDDCGWCRRMR